jgi:hypothetical protein
MKAYYWQFENVVKAITLCCITMTENHHLVKKILYIAWQLIVLISKTWSKHMVKFPYESFFSGNLLM